MNSHTLELARQAAAEVRDPELPMLTLADLGVLRDVCCRHGRIVVTITPTYSGCPAMSAIRADVAKALSAAGFADAEIRTTLSPAWSSDWITATGRRKLARHGIAPPGAAPARSKGPIPLTLKTRRHAVPCPRCASADTEPVSEFGATPCKALHRCRSCREPFERVKEI
ncbi:phenylacetate-CoA oxygenase subunit PaaJ [Mycobacterium intermedium]|uniref:Phenylacetate-CoA oxygenase subunit PaaJ n=1 Tax=Mycobacterium intermedium TaxID=28445 RepID=A0A1E3S607_MYCIE|nr:1,2-phenylacetyl-CoA epoxidase subunit PaaD [Mycobacterium intermedium]MCV6963613.1 phenylacetate-CoA oxygenase subunit PaaJ [Mycobacterium intermedium]ODQ97615.1 phenylacetate-CoA oxygenase subunit PaaJ [Mycobacterium intermedium]OPE46966.1 phenylacetate-CoA oxygenase subunit PaaJ [Mycobacterium intermedium]ORB09621.1 phenylacetate-CoA oxygenase subunit PaaJ [Mycobacterium intermedium]